MSKLYLDTETVGLHYFPVLIQYAYDDGPVQLWEPWCNPAQDTLDLIEEFLKHNLIGFNLAFDFFHLCKLYTTLYLMKDRSKHPEDCIEELVDCEEQARFQNICLKPRAALDLMLQARKGPFQALMAREPIRVRRVPTQLAWKLAEELEKRVSIDGIYFAKQKDKRAPRWKVLDCHKEDGTINPNFKDIVLRFRASGALKVLCQHIFKIPAPVLYSDIEVPREYWPVEHGYAPYAKAVMNDKSLSFSDRHRAWPTVIKEHIIHWRYNAEARKYAANDVVLTRRLHKEFFNDMPAGDDDSELACCVAACRWRGYPVDIPLIKELRAKAIARIQNTPVAPRQARKYLLQVMDDIERISIRDTKKETLGELSKWKIEIDGKEVPHPAALRAKEIIDARKALKEVELFDKLILAGRFHASFVVIGALSSRMSGSDGLNPQGIKHDKYVRAAFKLCDEENYILCGGDFKSFEVSIAAAVFQDEALNETIKSGIKIHAVLGQELFPQYTYDQIVASDGNGTMYPEGDMYDKGKKGIFAILYGGDENTWKKKLEIPVEVGKPVLLRFKKKYPGIGRFDKKVFDDFAALRQPNGIGSAVHWHQPKEYVETFLGFRRFFTLENKIAKILFDLAEDMPESWKHIKVKVSRRIEKIQTACGATRSALYGAAFGIISATMRAVKNHYIQSPGAEITKAVQRTIWDVQPIGVNLWVVQPANIHDEIMTPTRIEYAPQVKEAVLNTVARYRKHVPLLAIDWFENIDSWADKKGKAIQKEETLCQAMLQES